MYYFLFKAFSTKIFIFIFFIKKFLFLTVFHVNMWIGERGGTDYSRIFFFVSFHKKFFIPLFCVIILRWFETFLSVGKIKKIVHLEIFLAFGWRIWDPWREGNLRDEIRFKKEKFWNLRRENIWKFETWGNIYIWNGLLRVICHVKVSCTRGGGS